MKKILFLAAALVAFAACEKDPEKGKKPEGPVTEVTLGGETYKVVTLADGSVWMTENLRYVPAGKTVSEDPATNATGIYYPYKVEEGKAVVLKDEASIKEFGYLYDISTALGETLTAENFKAFEGAQGICPKGWHIPTRQDWLNVLGAAQKAKNEEQAPKNPEAPYYDEDTEGAKGSLIIGSEFNFLLTGYINANTMKYAVSPLTSADNCNDESLYGKPTLSYYLCSTGYQYEDSQSKQQFFGAMAMYAKNNKDGKIVCGYNTIGNGSALRCVMDSEN